MRALALIISVLAGGALAAAPVAGPDMHYADADGRYLGIYRNAVDPDTQEVVAPVRVPPGAVLVPSEPPQIGMKWDADAPGWVADPNYTPPPPPPPTAVDILNLLVSTGTITEDQKNTLLNR